MNNLLLILVGCAPKSEVVASSSASESTGWAAAVEALDARVAFHRDRIQARPSSWVEADRLAGVLRQRARLTGDYDDYAAAEDVYSDAFAVAPAGSGPLLGRARLHFTLHRLPQAQADLAILQERGFLTAAVRSGVDDLAADIALERGELSVARAHWQDREQSSPSLHSAAALARIDWLEGRMDTADDWFVTAQQRYHGTDTEPMAWIHLQRGLIDLDQGQPAAALAHYRDAETALSGYWLVDEHIAEALVLTGQAEAAMARYVDVVERTHSPELQGALAGLLMARGESDEAEALLAAAEATYDQQLVRFPEAAAGHALSHTLEWSEDTAAALALAERNAEIRPNGAALSLLSQARLAHGDAVGAVSAAQQGLATGTRSADLLVAAAAAAAAVGDGAAAQGFLTQARRIDAGASLEG